MTRVTASGRCLCRASGRHAGWLVQRSARLSKDDWLARIGIEVFYDRAINGNVSSF